MVGDIHLARLGERLHPLREPDRVADRGVFEAQVLADRADDHLARVDPHAHREAEPLVAADLGGVRGELALQRQRRPAGPLGVILVGERSAEQRHDAVAGELVDGALEAVDAVAQDREEALHDRPPGLRVGLLGELHRADHVGEQHGHLLALAVEIGAGAKDLLRQMRWGVVARIARARTTVVEARRPRRQRRPA